MENFEISLVIKDSDILTEIKKLKENEIESYLLRAMRIGANALRYARGEVDIDALKTTGEYIIDTVKTTVEDHRKTIFATVQETLSGYFDPNNGHFNVRINNLIKGDGELQSILTQNIGGDNSRLKNTLDASLGQGSELHKLFDPDNKSSAIAAISDGVNNALEVQKNIVLKEFSLDEDNSALSRLIKEIKEKNDGFSKDMGDKVEGLLKELSLDEKDSALSKLVEQVEKAQKAINHQFSTDSEDSALSKLISKVENSQNTITKEFSLDQENSALSRLSKALEETKTTINNNLTLDDQNSPFYKLKAELLQVLQNQTTSNREFQKEVTQVIATLDTTKKVAAQSTTHGHVFEEALCHFLGEVGKHTGDIVSSTGQTTGKIAKCKVGDAVITLGENKVAAGANIVFEAKKNKKYNKIKALEEIKQARENRESEVGVFVFSKKTLPSDCDVFSRNGNDIIVAWDMDDRDTDVYLKAAISLAEYICTAKSKDNEGLAIDLGLMDTTRELIENSIDGISSLTKWNQTITNSSTKIAGELEKRNNDLNNSIENLNKLFDKIKQIDGKEAA